MASEQIQLSRGRPRVVLPAPDARLTRRIEGASGLEGLAEVVAEHPDSMDAWAALGARHEAEGDSVQAVVAAYACYRIGYHRGLDALRKNGWRGAELVMWADEPNRGFLRCLDGLRRLAGRIGEREEEARCAGFLLQLDPDWPPAESA